MLTCPPSSLFFFVFFFAPIAQLGLTSNLFKKTKAKKR